MKPFEECFVLGFGLGLGKASVVPDEEADRLADDLLFIVKVAIDKALGTVPGEMRVSFAPDGLLLAFPDARATRVSEMLQAFRDIVPRANHKYARNLVPTAAVVRGTLHTMEAFNSSLNFEGSPPIIAARILAALRPGQLGVHASCFGERELPGLAEQKETILPGKHVGEEFRVKILPWILGESGPNGSEGGSAAPAAVPEKQPATDQGAGGESPSVASAIPELAPSPKPSAGRQTRVVVARSQTRARQSSRKNPAPIALSRGIDTWTGYLLHCDVCDFAKRNPNDQLETLRYLEGESSKALTVAGITGRSGAGVRLVGTGDGYSMFADSPDGSIRPSQLIRYAEEVLLSCVRGRAKKLASQLQVRIGIHVGSFTFEKMFDAQAAVGSGLHVVARVASLAGPGQILVSSPFRERLGRESSSDARRYLRSLFELGGPIVKHGEPIGVWHFDLSTGVGREPRRPPWYLRKQRRKNLILAHLDQLAARTCELFASVEEVTPKKIGCRVSVLMPDLEGRFLHITDLRGDPHTQMIDASSAVFPIGSGEYGRDLNVLSYLDGVPRYVVGLPDRRKRPEEFVRMLNEQGCLLRAEHVERWRRISRAVFTLPLDLPISDRRCVVMFDFLHPLSSASQETLELVVQQLLGRADLLPCLAILLESDAT